MNDAQGSDSQLEAAAGAAGPETVEAFELLSDETRLAILVALWEAYEPHAGDNSVSFSALYERVDAPDTGNFNYHLGRLTGHFVAETDEGYELRNAGLALVQTVIAGSGLGDRELPPTPIDRTCHRCGAQVEVSYDDERLYNRCPACAGNIGPDSAEDAPAGTVMAQDLDPAGLVDRTPGEVFVAGSIEFIQHAGLFSRGVCPQCSGAVEGSMQVCDDHDAPPGELCGQCGTRDEVRVRYYCTVCKHGLSFPVEGAVHDHPAVVAHRHEHGVPQTFDLDDPADCGRMWDHLMSYGHTVTSTDPLRVRVTVPGDDESLELMVDESIDVVEVTRSRG